MYITVPKCIQSRLIYTPWYGCLGRSHVLLWPGHKLVINVTCPNVPRKHLPIWVDFIDFVYFSWKFLTNHVQTMSKEHLRGKYFLMELCIMSFVLYWNDPICIKVGAPKLFCILQSYVGMAGCLTMCIPGFLLRILWWCQSGGHPENNLARFGYILDMKVGKKTESFYVFSYH
jgi:hypothetical protein